MKKPTARQLPDAGWVARLGPQVREPPVFTVNDEVEFERWIESTIQQVGKPVLDGMLANRKNIRPIDLSPHNASLKFLMMEIAEAYFAALDDHNMRRDPDKPPLKLRQAKPDSSDYDYGADSGVGIGNWEDHWREAYYVPRGNPGTNRVVKNGPPLAPLRMVHEMVRRWWLEHDLPGGFSPKFDYKHDPPYDLDYCNSPARLLTLVVTWLNPEYQIANVDSICRKARK